LLIACPLLHYEELDPMDNSLTQLNTCLEEALSLIETNKETEAIIDMWGQMPGILSDSG
jgi:hypothetical protein